MTATGGSSGLLTQEAGAAGLDGTGGGVVSYTFTASEPGTYMYHSGTQPYLQIEMGLVGALIVRPTLFNSADAANRKAYGDADSAFDHEYLFLLSDMDDKIHNAVELQVQAATSVPVGGLPITVDMSKRFAVYWFIYDVVVNNNCGSVTSAAATLAVRPVFARNVITNRSSTATGGNIITTPPTKSTERVNFSSLRLFTGTPRTLPPPALRALRPSPQV